MGRSLVISILLLFDLIAFALAVAAEHRRAKGTVQKDPSQTTTWCEYNSDIATGLGIGAFLFLLASHTLVGIVTRCLCCRSNLKPGGSRIIAALFFFLSWVSFLIAEICLVAGVARNAKRYNLRGYFGANDSDCEGLRQGTFAAGAAFTLITMILSVPYYLFYIKANEDSWKTYRADPGVGMTWYH